MKKVIPFVVSLLLFTGCIDKRPEPDVNEQTDVTEVTTVYAAAEVTAETTVTSLKYDPIFLTETTRQTEYVPIDISLGYSGDVDMVVNYGGKTYIYVKTVDPDDSMKLTFAGIITKCEASPDGNYSSNFAPVGSSVYTDGKGSMIVKLTPDCACLCECPSETEITEVTTDTVTETEAAETNAVSETEDELIADDGIYEIVPVSETSAESETALSETGIAGN